MANRRRMAAICVLCATARASAGVIAADSFLNNAVTPSAPNLANGEYLTSTSSPSGIQFRRSNANGGGLNPSIAGFAGPWSGNVTINDGAVAQWTPEYTGIPAPQSIAYQAGGRARFGGASNTNALQRRVQRALSAYTPSSTYYLSLSSQVLSGDADDSTTGVQGFVGIGFTGLGTSITDDAYFATGDRMRGVLIGAYNDRNLHTDYVVRHVGSNGVIQNDVIENEIVTSSPTPPNPPTRFTVVRIDYNDDPANPLGNSKLTVWHQPSSATLFSEAAATAASTPFVFRTFALSSDADITHLTFVGNNWSRPASFDEPRLGTAWRDVAIAPENTWAVDADGTWATATNWSYGVSPDAAGASVTFSTAITATRTVTLDAPASVGSIRFASPAGYSIAGSSSLTIAGASGAITVASGSHSITAPISIQTGTAIAVASGAALTVGTASIASGTTSITGAGSFTATGTLSNQATLSLGSATASIAAISGNGTLTVAAGSTATVGTSAGGSVLVQDSLTVDGSLSLVPHSGATASTGAVKSLAIGAAGRLDLSNATLAVDYTGASVFGTIRAGVLAGRNGGTWDGFGIVSAGLASATSESIGIAEAGAIGLASLGGQPLDGDAVVVRRTLKGDANLDGRVNFDDLLILAANYNQSGREWYQGNFTYDADDAVNFDDLLLLAASYNQALPSGGAWALAVVPEPSAALLASAVLVALTRRRRAVR